MTFTHQRLISRVPLLLSGALGLLAMTGLVGLTGCHASQTHQVAIQGASNSLATQTTAYNIRVNNPAGGVVVMVDDTLDTPVVQARSRPSRTSASEFVQATLQGSALAVGRSDAFVTSQAIIDITVWVPRSDGVTVRSNYGSARLVNVEGPIDVELGEGTGTGGSIELRTNHPLTQGLRLVTPGGWIKAMIPIRSAGIVELQAPDGRAFLRSSGGELSETKTGKGYHTGILNGGSRAITLLSGSGDVTLELVD